MCTRRVRGTGAGGLEATHPNLTVPVRGPHVLPRVPHGAGDVGDVRLQVPRHVAHAGHRRGPVHGDHRRDRYGLGILCQRGAEHKPHDRIPPEVRGATVTCPAELAGRILTLQDRNGVLVVGHPIQGDHDPRLGPEQGATSHRVAPHQPEQGGEGEGGDQGEGADAIGHGGLQLIERNCSSLGSIKPSDQ